MTRPLGFVAAAAAIVLAALMWRQYTSTPPGAVPARSAVDATSPPRDVTVSPDTSGAQVPALPSAQPRAQEPRARNDRRDAESAQTPPVTPDVAPDSNRPAEAPEVVQFQPLVAVPPPAVPPPAAPPPVDRPVAIEREFPAGPPAVRAPPVPSDVELVAVQGVVRRYEETYRQLDASAVAAIWPSVDSRSLSRLFKSIERQDLRFETCAYAVAEARATATCAGSLTYVPRVGSATPRTDRHTWSIQLERAGQHWQIVSVTAQ